VVAVVRETNTGWGPSEFLALAGIVSTLIIALVTIRVSGRQQAQACQEDREDHRWREAISVLGPVSGLLRQGNPDAIFPSQLSSPTKGWLDSTRARLEDHQRRWESELRPGVLSIAVGSHQPTQREMAAQLSAAIDSAFSTITWYADMANEGDANVDWLLEPMADAHRKRGAFSRIWLHRSVAIRLQVALPRP
jgi:hypothetical protein